MIRVLLIPSSDYLGHPFPQRHNQIFERIHDGKNFEVHVARFHIYDKARLSSKCIIHDMPLEFKTESSLSREEAINYIMREVLQNVKATFKPEKYQEMKRYTKEKLGIKLPD
ncbi:MAG: hypothetical protein QXK88_09810 [Desulfurococcaceae archaeon]